MSARHRSPSPPADGSAGPIRTCVGCRARAAAEDLLRVVEVDGLIGPDPQRRLPGRGAYLHRDPQCYDAAVRRRAFARALRLPQVLPSSTVLDHLLQVVQGTQTAPQTRGPLARTKAGPTHREQAVKTQR